MKERKPDGGLAEWIETLEAMGGEDDGEMLCLLLELRRFREDKPELIEQLEALAALAEERREFIVNGVDFGYIRIPDDQNDKATGTYERCLLKPKYAAGAILNEVRAQVADELATEFGQIAQTLKPNSVAYRAAKSAVFRCVAAAARIRAGEVPHA
ncbi:hypothetical protein [Erwinia phage Gungnir39]|nr:hypothetical protein [Erwinia phage Gungnir39]